MDVAVPVVPDTTPAPSSVQRLRGSSRPRPPAATTPSPSPTPLCISAPSTTAIPLTRKTVVGDISDIDVTGAARQRHRGATHTRPGMPGTSKPALLTGGPYPEASGRLAGRPAP